MGLGQHEGARVNDDKFQFWVNNLFKSFKIFVFTVVNIACDIF